jgi:hypothetical protein
MAPGDRLARVQAFIQEATWPRGYVTHPARRSLYRAIADVLLRLPAEIFERVEAETSIVFEDSKMGACSLRGGNVIVIFEKGLMGSEIFLKGLIAHELAHNAIGIDHEEADADRLALSWGFDEVRELGREGN